MSHYPHNTAIAPKSTNVLGYIYSEGKLSASPHRTPILSTCSQATTVKAVPSFLGAYKCLDWLIPNCSSSLLIRHSRVTSCGLKIWATSFAERSSISTITNLIQSHHEACVLMDNKPCVQAHEKLLRAQFSHSSRISTFLSTASCFAINIQHHVG